MCLNCTLPSIISQAPKKAKRRQQQGEGGSSNVFSMFEQSQIQEYKEVRFFPHHISRTSKLKFSSCINWSLSRPWLKGDILWRSNNWWLYHLTLEVTQASFQKDIDLIGLAAWQQKMSSSTRQDSKSELFQWQRLPLLWGSSVILLRLSKHSLCDPTGMPPNSWWTVIFIKAGKTSSR